MCLLLIIHFNTIFIASKRIGMTLKCHVSPSGACSTRSAGSESQRHTEMQSSHSDTSRGVHEHTVQCRAEGSLQLQSRQSNFNYQLSYFVETFAKEIRRPSHDNHIPGYIITATRGKYSKSRNGLSFSRVNV